MLASPTPLTPNGWFGFGTSTMTVSIGTVRSEATGTRYYRARIRLVEGESAKLPVGTVLVPGMPVEAFLRTTDRSPLAYLVEPLAQYFSRALRES